jgi:hypothetical protein
MSAPASVPYAFPDVPGLELVPMTAAHLDEAAQLMVEAKLRRPCDGEHGHPGWLPEFGVLPPQPCTDPLEHVRDELAQELADPPGSPFAPARQSADTWAGALIFQGRPLQFEILRLEDAPGAAIDLTLRASRERPDWFWREIHRPIFEALAGVGIQRVDYWAPLGGGDQAWRAFYAEQLGAVKTADWKTGRPGFLRGGGMRWEWPVTLARFTGWPARKHVGFDQTLGRVRVWEATAADLPALHQLIDDTIPPARKALTHRVAEEWWHLDRATLLLGTRDGVLRYARVIRPRRGTQGGMAFLSGLFDEPELEQSAQLALQWAKQAGYATLSIFAKPEALAAGRVPQFMQARHARIVKEHREFREPFTEIEFDVP